MKFNKFIINKILNQVKNLFFFLPRRIRKWVENRKRIISKENIFFWFYIGLVYKCGKTMTNILVYRSVFRAFRFRRVNETHTQLKKKKINVIHRKMKNQS